MNKSQTKTVPIRQITQAQITDYENHQRIVATLKRELKDKSEVLETLENLYAQMLEKGFAQEQGELRLVLDVSTRKATPKYKELFAQIAGPRAVEQAQEDAGSTEIKHVKVISSVIV
jgi:hypothetical protein